MLSHIDLMTDKTSCTDCNIKKCNKLANKDKYMKKIAIKEETVNSLNKINIFTSTSFRVAALELNCWVMP